METIVTNNIVGVAQNIVGVGGNQIVVQQIPQQIQNAKFVTAVNVNQHINNGQQITLIKPIQPLVPADHGQPVTITRVHDLVREIDPNVQLDEEVEDTLLTLADEFVDNVINGACRLAKHRHVPSLEVKDVQLYLEKSFNMWLPGFGTDELRPYKRATLTESHKQRLALIRRALKKY